MKKIFFLLSLTLLLSSLSRAAPAPALKDYLQIQTLLAHDTFAGVIDAAKKFENSSKTLKGLNVSKDYAALLNAKNIKDAREAFVPVSKAVRDWAKTNHPEGLITVYCPMKKAYWLQKKGEVANPFYGKEMLECGVEE